MTDPLRMRDLPDPEGMLSSILADEGAVSRSRGTPWWTLAAAAALCVLVLGSGVWALAGGPGRDQIGPAGGPAPTWAGPVPSPTPSATAATPTHSVSPSRQRPTPTPTPTPTRTPTPTPSSTRTPTPEPSDTPEATRAPTEEPTWVYTPGVEDAASSAPTRTGSRPGGQQALPAETGTESRPAPTTERSSTSEPTQQPNS